MERDHFSLRTHFSNLIHARCSASDSDLPTTVLYKRSLSIRGPSKSTRGITPIVGIMPCHLSTLNPGPRSRSSHAETLPRIEIVHAAFTKRYHEHNQSGPRTFFFFFLHDSIPLSVVLLYIKNIVTRQIIQ